MATFVSDTFTGANGTTLEAHTGETGATWVKHPVTLSSSSVLTDANRVRPNSSTNVAYYASGLPSTADYTITADVYIASIAGTAGVRGRFNTIANTCYEARANPVASAWELRRIVNNSATILLSVAHTFTAGELYSALTLTLQGTLVSFSQGGTPLGSKTDTAITAAGRAGLQMQASGATDNTHNTHLDTFSAVDIDYSLTGPASGLQNVASSNFTVALPPGVSVGSPVTLTPSAGGAGGTFTPATVQFAAATPGASATFTYTPSAVGTVTIAATNNGGLVDPPGAGYFSDSNAISLVGLTFWPTRVSAAFEVLYNGDRNVDSVVTLCQFKLHSDPDQPWAAGQGGWRDTMPVVRNAVDNSGVALSDGIRGWYGQLILLTQNTQYDVKVTVTDPDGGGGTVVSTVTTKPDPAAIGAANYYVDAVNGLDANNGLTLGTAFQTLNKAITQVNSDGGGKVVEFETGSYVSDSTTPVLSSNGNTFYAKNAAVAYANTVKCQNRTFADPQPANSGTRSVITGGKFAAPNTASWAQVNLVGPATGNTYATWQYQGTTASTTSVSTFLFGTSATDDNPQYVAKWPTSGSNGAYTLASAAGWAEVLYNNGSYVSGVYLESGAPYRLYVRLPGDVDPNGFYCSWDDASASSGFGLTINGTANRLEGFEFRSKGNAVVPQGADGSLRYCLFTGFVRGAWTHGTTGGGNLGYYLVEGCCFRHFNMWSPDNLGSGLNGFVPWVYIKGHITLTGGSGTISTSSAQTTPIDVEYGCTLEWCRSTVSGSHDTGPVSEDLTPVALAQRRYCSIGSAMYGNILSKAQDDGPELSTDAIISAAAWDNYISYVLTGASGSGGYGPQYFVFNYWWQVGTEGEPIDDLSTGGSTPFPTGTTFKNGFSANPYGRVFFYHNTFATNSLRHVVTTGWPGGTTLECPALFNNGGGLSTVFTLQNNVSLVTGYACYVAGTNITTNGAVYREDHNEWASTTPTIAHRVIHVNGVSYTTLTAYKAASGQGGSDNIVGGDGFTTNLSGQFTNFATGDLSYLAGSPWFAAGTKIGNVSDIPLAAGIHPVDAGGGYQGAGPNLGAYVGLSPAAPTFSSLDLVLQVSSLQSVRLVGVGTAWDGNTHFSLAGVSGVTITIQVVTDASHATLTVQTGTATGTVTISENTDAATTTVSVVPAPVPATYNSGLAWDLIPQQILQTGVATHYIWQDPREDTLPYYVTVPVVTPTYALLTVNGPSQMFAQHATLFGTVNIQINHFNLRFPGATTLGGTPVFIKVIVDGCQYMIQTQATVTVPRVVYDVLMQSSDYSAVLV